MCSALVKFIPPIPLYPKSALTQGRPGDPAEELSERPSERWSGAYAPAEAERGIYKFHRRSAELWVLFVSYLLWGDCES